MALPMAGAIWSFLGRSLLLPTTRAAVVSTAVSFGRDVVRDLLVRQLDRSITPNKFQNRFAKATGANPAILETNAGQVELIARCFETVRDIENRNLGATYLAESCAVHYVEGGRQKTTALLAMQAAVADDNYYPLLVFATNINSRPIVNQRDCALYAACLYAHYYDAKQYGDVFSTSSGDDESAVRNATLNDRTTYQWFANTWIFWRDPYSPRIGEVADLMMDVNAWLRVGHFIYQLRNFLIVTSSATSLPGLKKWDSIGILNFAIDSGSVLMADDRQVLHTINSNTTQEDIQNAAKDMNYPYFKATYQTSISTPGKVGQPPIGTLMQALDHLARLSRNILDPATRLELCDALYTLSENIKRDVA